MCISLVPSISRVFVDGLLLSQHTAQISHHLIQTPDTLTGLAASQWETSLQSNAASHWLGANLESAPLLQRSLQTNPEECSLLINCGLLRAPMWTYLPTVVFCVCVHLDDVVDCCICHTFVYSNDPLSATRGHCCTWRCDKLSHGPC